MDDPLESRLAQRMARIRWRALCCVGAAALSACFGDELDDPRRPDTLDAQTADPLRDAGQARDGGEPARDAEPPVSSSPEAGLDAAASGLDAAVLGPEPGRLAGITAAHNAARARAVTVNPLAPLRWSPEIAQVAQSYAEKLAAGCADGLTHSTREERHDWGENLAAFAITGGTGREPNGSAEATVELWESELACYSYGPFQSGVNDTCSAACSAYGGCGHLTQMLWRKTQSLGCGVADCTQGRTRKSYWVCHYDPAGNVPGQLPY